MLPNIEHDMVFYLIIIIGDYEVPNHWRFIVSMNYLAEIISVLKLAISMAKWWIWIWLMLPFSAEECISEKRKYFLTQIFTVSCSVSKSVIKPSPTFYEITQKVITLSSTSSK